MNAVILKQKRTLKATIFGSTILSVTAFLWYANLNTPYRLIVLLVVGLVFLGFSVRYEIEENFNNYKRFTLFGATILKLKLKVPFPDYISLFSGSFKNANEWGPVAALGTESTYDIVVVKFFKGNSNTIVYKSNNYNDAFAKAKQLSALLKVRIHTTVKNSST